MSSVAGIIVAAGSSSRLGQPKQLIPIGGEPMLQRAIRFVHEAGAEPVFVVLGAHREIIEARVNFGPAEVVVNNEWTEGLASSIRAGVRAADQASSEESGLLLMICDQPRVSADHLRRMIQVFQAQPPGTAVASVYAGTRGIPAIFPRLAIDHLCALRGDQGARSLLARPPWMVVEVPLEGGEIDIDRPEDLEQIR